MYIIIYDLLLNPSLLLVVLSLDSSLWPFSSSFPSQPAFKVITDWQHLWEVRSYTHMHDFLLALETNFDALSTRAYSQQTHPTAHVLKQYHWVDYISRNDRATLICIRNKITNQPNRLLSNSRRHNWLWRTYASHWSRCWLSHARTAKVGWPQARVKLRRLQWHTRFPPPTSCPCNNDKLAYIQTQCWKMCMRKCSFISMWMCLYECFL